MEEARFEEILTERSGTRTKETRPIGVTNKLIDLLSENQREVMVMVQKNSDSIQRLNDNVTTLTEGILKIEEKFDFVEMQEDLKSVKLELKKSLQAQKNISKVLALAACAAEYVLQLTDSDPWEILFSKN